MVVTTSNLATGEEKAYTLLADQAVVAAYAQEQDDWNTWDYAKRYHAYLVFGSRTVRCGNWAALVEEALT